MMDVIITWCVIAAFLVVVCLVCSVRALRDGDCPGFRKDREDVQQAPDPSSGVPWNSINAIQ